MHRRSFLTNSALSLGMAGLQAVPLGRVLDVSTLGVVPDGKTLLTRVLQSAIDKTFQSGGGVISFPPGRYLTGGLEIKSRITLYLEAGAVLLGSTDFNDYPVCPGPPAKGDANSRHLLYALDAEDIGLCGPGTVDGQGESYWEKSDHQAPRPEDAYQDSSAFYWKATDRRPSPMVEFARCRNVRVQGVTLSGAAGWTMRPVNCYDVFIDGVRIRNPIYGPNTDGLDITSCSNVFVSNCSIYTGDDAICIKSENPYGGPTLPTKNITITNCRLTTCCNGLKFGTATHGAYENITFTNSVVDSDADPVHGRVIGGINLEMVDGGSIDGVVISNIQMKNTRTPIFMRLGNRTPSHLSFVRNILIEGIQASGGLLTSSITGLDNMRVSDVTLSDMRFRTTEGGDASLRSIVVGERPKQYPESRMFGRLPAYGLYVRHADKIRLHNLEFITDRPDGRPAVVFEDAEDVVVDGLLASSPVGSAPMMDFRNVRNAFVHACRAPRGAGSLVEVSGAGSRDIRLVGNETSGCAEPVRYTGGASQPAGAAS